MNDKEEIDIIDLELSKSTSLLDLTKKATLLKQQYDDKIVNKVFSKYRRKLSTALSRINIDTEKLTRVQLPETNQQPILNAECIGMSTEFVANKLEVTNGKIII